MIGVWFVLWSLLSTALWAALALAFRLTVGQDGRTVTLHYPRQDGVTLLTVCVETEGNKDDPWYLNSCWEPRQDTSVEQYRVRYGTTWIRAHLQLDNRGSVQTLQTPRVWVSPE